MKPGEEEEDEEGLVINEVMEEDGEEEAVGYYDEEDDLDQIESQMYGGRRGSASAPLKRNVARYEIEGLDIEVMPVDEEEDEDEDDEEEDTYDDPSYKVVDSPEGGVVEVEYIDEEDSEGGGRDEEGYFGNAGAEEDSEEEDDSDDEDSLSQPALIDALRENYVSDPGPTEKRANMDQRHPKFSGLSNMQIIQRMVAKGKVVNPAEEDDEEEAHFTINDKFALAKMGVRIAEKRRRDDDGNEIVVSKAKQIKYLFLGGGVPLEPILAHPQLNVILEKFRRELGHRRNTYGEKIRFKFAPIKVDPSSIVPASVSGSAGSSSIGSEETDAECLATDDESENELMNGSIAAWLVPENGSRSPTPEFEMEEPEFVFNGGSHSIEPPTKKRKQKHEPQPHTDGKIYPKPGFSYSCLIAMSLKNSKTGCLPVSEIYKFMCDHFPYFKTAPSGWKNSVRHNLSLNKCFEKIEKPGNGARKGCLWALNPAKIHKMDEEVQKWSRKDPMSIKRAMSDPENLELLERGELKKDYSGNGSDEDEEEEFGEASSTTVVTSTQRPADQKLHLKKEQDPLDFGTITGVQGNFIGTTLAPQTYTLAFSNLTTTSTPIIIRRAHSTQVK